MTSSADDITIDDVDTILEVAGEVLVENAPDPGDTRIERLARWVVANLDAIVTMQRAGAYTLFTTSRVRAVRLGERILLDLSGRKEFSPGEAQEVATALLRAAHQARTE